MSTRALNTRALTLAIATVVAWSGVDTSYGQSRAPPPREAPQLEIKTLPLPDSGTTSDWRASKLIGATMTNVLDESVGTIEDIVIDADGKVVAVMVSVGGFLGLGETSVAIGLRHLVITHADVDQLAVKTSLSRKAIEQAAALELESDTPLPQGGQK
jgi:hypothetical protein